MAKSNIQNKLDALQGYKGPDFKLDHDQLKREEVAIKAGLQKIYDKNSAPFPKDYWEKPENKKLLHELFFEM